MNTSKTIEALNSLLIGINPTIIYNEGWMIRLLVIESMIQRLVIKGFDFGKLKQENWSSEALIKSPFVNAKTKREGYTHADIILGDFELDYEKCGEAILKKENANILGVIEAKMGSNLSQNTSNAKNYNQASRSICCLSYITRDTDCDIFFIVAAPEKKIKDYNIENQINPENIKNQIEERFNHYFETNEENILSQKDSILKQVQKCKILVIGYNEWIVEIEKNEPNKIMREFYNNCLKFNKIPNATF